MFRVIPFIPSSLISLQIVIIFLPSFEKLKADAKVFSNQIHTVMYISEIVISISKIEIKLSISSVEWCFFIRHGRKVDFSRFFSSIECRKLIRNFSFELRWVHKLLNLSMFTFWCRYDFWIDTKSPFLKRKIVIRELRSIEIWDKTFLKINCQMYDCLLLVNIMIGS